MITEIAIEGFKSFGYPAEAIPLRPVNFVAGPNSAGKTNILAALEFLQNCVLADCAFAVNELGGPGEIRHRARGPGDDGRPLSIRIELVNAKPFQSSEWAIRAMSYELSISIGGNRESPVIEKETLIADLERDGSVREFRVERDRESVSLADTLKPGRVSNFALPPQGHARTFIGSDMFYPPCMFLREELSRWRFFDINPSAARQPQTGRSGIELGKHGENLPAVLNDMVNSGNEAAIRSFTQSMQASVPGLECIEPVRLPGGAGWSFRVGEETAPEPFSAASVSGGTVRLAALFLITDWLARAGSLIGYEEPENGVHPDLRQTIVESIRNAAELHGAQFIATTHNPDFLDLLDPCETLLCEKSNGSTSVRPASAVENLEVFLKSFSLGELWKQGALESMQ